MQPRPWQGPDFKPKMIHNAPAESPQNVNTKQTNSESAELCQQMAEQEKEVDRPMRLPQPDYVTSDSTSEPMRGREPEAKGVRRGDSHLESKK